MGRLASAVGITKSGLYAHFSSKEELQLATIAYVRDVFEAEVVRDASEDPDNGLRALLERWLGFFEQKVFPGGCFLIVSAVEFAGRAGPVREALEAALDREIAALETTIRHGKQTGEVRATTDASQAAFELHSILMNANAMFQIKGDPAVFEHARVAIRKLVYR